MVVNRFSLAHATAHHIKGVPFVVRPWMVWILAMLLYNIGATGLASVAQLYIPLSLYACLFVTLLVVNLLDHHSRRLLRHRLALFLSLDVTGSPNGGTVTFVETVTAEWNKYSA